MRSTPFLRRVGRAVRKALLPTQHRCSKRRFLAAGGDASLRYDYPLTDRAGTLLDLGGYEGNWTAEMLSRFPQCSSTIFEPLPVYAHALGDRFDHDARVRICDFGLGSSTRTAPMTVAGDSSSVHAIGDQHEEVQIVDIAEWWECSGLASVDVIKINIEGGEFEILPRLIETGLIQRIEYVQVQFHQFVPDARRQMNAILGQLALTHEPTYRFPFVWENWRRRDG